MKTCTLFLISLSCVLHFNCYVMIFKNTTVMTMSNEQKCMMYQSIEHTEDVDLLYINPYSIPFKYAITPPIYFTTASSDNKHSISFVHNILIGEKCSCGKSTCLYAIDPAGQMHLVSSPYCNYRSFKRIPQLPCKWVLNLAEQHQFVTSQQHQFSYIKQLPKIPAERL